ncbi:hypothetical protein [Bradyrhizobium sp.]|jgi:hypothetical protein|uniref:hypothetical protein n=1 Tax=Bradyrhizobium sp. TaxID=376 RepID=UPI002DDCC715|nr:hypothetical protein [Bradyrhizobium sp.]HEV2155402.1 hypothetical protein [Bradyrhizobium sp.]
MIQIKAPDGSIVQFPDGTPDETIVGVMKQNYPPSLSSVAASTAPDTAAQPQVAAARANADTTALTQAAQPKGWMDTLRDAVFDGNRGVMGVVDQGVRGVAQGLTTVAGLPADAAAGAKAVSGYVADKVGVPDIVQAAIRNSPPGAAVNGVAALQPYVGGDALQHYLDTANNATADTLGVARPVQEGTTILERGTNRVGQEVGAMLVPVAGAITKGAKIGVDAARKLPGLVRAFVEPAAIDPAKFAAKEGATAVAAGTGAAAADEIARASGAKKGDTAFTLADILGALSGAGLLGAARITAKPLDDIRQAIFSRDKFNNRVVQENVTDRLLNNADSVPKTEGQPIDAQPLIDAIMGGRRVSDTIPGFKESVADRTGDAGLATLEYGRQSGPNAGKFVQQRAENTTAVDNAMNANAPDGNPAALRAELALERERRLTDAGVNRQNAQEDFDRATQALQPALTGEGRGADIRQALEAASEGARNILRAAWEPVNNSGARVDMAPLADEFQGVRRGMSTAEAERFQPNETDIPRRLSGDREVSPAVTDAEGNVIQPAVTEPITQPINEVTGLRSALTDASREARTAGRTNEARIIDQHVEALDRYLDDAVPPELRQSYDEARAATVDYHDRFTRPQTAIAQTLDRQEGQYRQPDSAVTRKFVQDDQGRIADFQALMREAGNDQRTVAAVRDQILADVRDRGLLERPDQLRDYLARYNTILSDRRFAGVRGELDNAAGLRRTLDESTAAETQLTRELGTAERPGTSTVGKYLQYGDERSQDALKGVLASKDPAAAIDEMLRFVNDAPEAVAGARKSFWDLMQSRARSNGETTKTVDGAQPWMPNRLKNFLDDPAAAAVAERLYRDDPEQLANIRKISDELQNVDLRTRGKAVNTSGTAQSISNVLTPETLQSRLYAYKRGQTSLGFMLTALGSVAARRLVRGAQGEAIEKLLDRALLDPDLAAQLLKENNPANRAALARTAKGYLGNEASSVTDLLNGPEPKDETRDAVMRKDNGR